MRLIVLLLALAALVSTFTQEEEGFAAPEPAIAVCCVVLVVGGLLYVGGRRRSPGEIASAAEDARDRDFLSRVALVGFLLRVGLALAIQLLGWQTSIAPDEGTFHGNAWILTSWIKGDTIFWLYSRYAGSLQVGYFYLLAGIYLTFGVGRILPVLLNCAFGAAAAYPVYRIASELSGRTAARWAAILVTIFPSLVLWSALLIRDSIVVLVLLWIIATVLALRKSFGVLALLRLIVLFAALGVLRQYLFVLVAFCVGASFAIGRAGRNGRSLAIGAVAVLGLFFLMRGTGLGLEEMERASLKSLALQRQYNSSVESAAGSFRPEVDISRPAGALLYLPVGLLYFLASPFPWQLLSAHQAFALPEMLFWYGLLPFVFIGLVRLVKTRFRDAAMLILSIFAITILYSLVEGNVGIIFRHRAQVIAPATVLAGVGIAAFLAKRAAAVPGRARATRPRETTA